MEKKKRVTLGPRADESVKAFFTRFFGSANGGAEYVVQSWPMLFRRTTATVLARLSLAERSAVIDSYNGTLLTPAFAGVALWQHMRDSIELEALADKWGIDGPALLLTLAEMAVFDLACLEVWACGYWAQVGTPGEVPLESYLDPRSLV
jgi:hypothetical protein